MNIKSLLQSAFYVSNYGDAALGQLLWLYGTLLATNTSQ